jgi:hypothetical protein
MRLFTTTLLTTIFLASGFSQINPEALSVSNPQNTFVIIIANEDYQVNTQQYVSDVTHAILEAEKFRKMLIEKYGISKHNISYYANANATQMKLLATKIARLVEKNENPAEVIFYYTGKYIEHDSKNIIYLLPTEFNNTDIRYAVNLEYFLQKLEKAPPIKVTLLIDGQTPSAARSASILEDGGKFFEIDNIQLTSTVKIRISNTEPFILPSNSEDESAKANHLDNNTLATAEDKKGPVIELTSHDISKNYKAKDKWLYIEGIASDDRDLFLVSVNGQEAHLEANGEFSAKVILHEGLNKIYIQAIDIHKNISNVVFPVTFQSSKSAPVDGEDSRSADAHDADEIRYYALLIGVNEYADPAMTNLDEPINDANKLYAVLTQEYSFPENQITLLKNPKRSDIIKQLDNYEKTLTEKDNLLIFYAGHGTWNSKVNKGYWLPSDAQLNNTSNWIRNSTISGYISGIPSRHTLLIADACFSGGIFKTRSISESPESIQRIYELPSRKAMTSGILSEVPDKSVFIEFFTKRLIENEEKYITAEQLFYSFKPAVINNSENIPQYGTIKNAGDEGGDFIFMRK